MASGVFLVSSFSSPSIEARTPFFTKPAIEFLEQILKPYHLVLEWGVGGSTLFFAKRVLRVTAIESQWGWFSSVCTVLEQDGLLNKCCLLLVPPDPEPSVDPLYHSCQRLGLLPVSYQAYASAIDARASFDLISVDGRARMACIMHAMAHLAPGGWLLLDNVERGNYSASLQLLAGWHYQDFWGLGTHLPSRWLTRIWQKPGLI